MTIMMVAPMIVHAQSASAISVLAGVSSPDTVVTGACLCVGKIDNCDANGDCVMKALDSCGGVPNQEVCDKDKLSTNDAECEGSKSYSCLVSGPETYTHLDSCIYQGFDPAAPLKDANIDAKCADLRLKAEQQAGQSALGKAVQIRKPILNILIPDLIFSDVRTSTDENGDIVIPWIGEYVAAVYRFLVNIASILAVVLIIREGALIILSGGGEEKVQGYKNIARILTGLVLAWSSYVLLYNVNASLVSFGPLHIKYAAPVYVVPSDEPVTKAVYITESGANSVPYFPQWEGPWAEMKPGDLGWPSQAAQSGRTCDTIHDRGCGPTSLAMVLKFYGVDVTPLDTAKWGLGCTGSWQPYDTMDAFSRQWPDLKGEVIQASASNKSTIRRKVMTLLLAGKPVVYNCAPCNGLTKSGDIFKRKDGTIGYDGHFMVLTGVVTPGYTAESNPDEVVIGVNDPGANENRRIRTMTLSQVMNGYKVAVYVDTQDKFQSINVAPK